MAPKGDGFEDFTVISYRVTSQIARVRLRIFDSLGRPVRTLANYEPSACTGQIIWDGLDDDKRRLRMGIYIVLLEALNSSGGTVESTKVAAVVAGKL
jgi:flagellar hook assembly protein FlgD